MILTVGTRGSKLALAQTEKFLQELKRLYSNVEFKIKVIKTLGDTENTQPLFAIDRQGIFEKEIDHALIKGEIDFAVSSLKDVPTVETEGTIIAAVPKRASPNDVLISKNNLPLKALPKGAIIGTGSLRRLAQIKFLRPDLEVVPIRGNLDTRIKKAKNEDFDGIIVAEAGLQRMGLEKLITERFSLEEFPSAPAQGALAIITRKDNTKIQKLLQIMDHPQTRAEVTAERSLMLQLEGGCRVPIGAIGKASDNYLSLQGIMFTLDGKSRISAFADGSLTEAKELGKKVAHKLLMQGAKQIEEEWRKKYGNR
ncbi:MAG: hydroxymethylbilane synthase [Candidatus Bathyarchaeota archaeon]|nr:hydroxymethylbilane synthase [Candidatus Bathyarchaeota archaeon]